MINWKNILICDGNFKFHRKFIKILEFGAFSISSKISSFDENFEFRRKFGISGKMLKFGEISISFKIFVFFQKFQILAKIQNFNFFPKIWNFNKNFKLPKISKYGEHFEFYSKFRVSAKFFEIRGKLGFSGKIIIFGENSEFWQFFSKFWSLRKILNLDESFQLRRTFWISAKI